jgi:hypothetical protein
MPSVNSKMATESDPINDEETAQTVNVIDRLNKENAACQQERDAALSELAVVKDQLERHRLAIGMVSTTAANACNGKAFDLYWLGRRDIEVARSGPGGPAIERILVEHTDEARRIADGDAWEHGYWAGTLSFARLTTGLAQVDDMKLYDGQCSDDEDEPPIPAADVRAAALAHYPVLDS